MNPTFRHIEIFVKDPLASMKFYTEVLGFELDTIQHEKFVWLTSGSYTVLLRPGKNMESASSYQDAKTGFVMCTDNLPETKKLLTGRGLVFKGTDGSENCLTFTDPDGNWFQLVDPNEH